MNWLSKHARGQGAADFLVTYGWALLIMLVVFSVFFYLRILNKSTITTPACVLPPGFTCKEFLMTSDGRLYLDVGQATGRQITVTAMGCGGPGANPEMRPVTPVPIGQGGHGFVTGPFGFSCANASPPNFRGTVTFAYSMAGSALNRTVKGSLVSFLSSGAPTPVPNPVTVLTSGANGVDIATEGTNVYYQGSGADLYSVPVTGGSGTLLSAEADACGLRDMAVEGGYTYYVDSCDGTTTAKKILSSGGTATQLATQAVGSGRHVALCGDGNMYIAYENTGNRVQFVPKAGGSFTLFYSLGGGDRDASAITCDSTQTYFGWSFSGELGNKTIGAPSGVSPTIFGPVGFISEIAVDNNYVYWADFVDQADGKGSVKKVPKGGGTITIISTGGSPWGLAIDGNAIYWSEETNNVIKRMAIAGGPIATLAENLSIPTGIAIDSTYVYWIETGSHTIKRALKNP